MPNQLKNWILGLITIVAATHSLSAPSEEPPDQEYELHFYPDQFATMPFDPAFNVMGDEVTIEAWMKFESGRLTNEFHMMCFQNAIGFRDELEEGPEPGVFFFIHTTSGTQTTSPRPALTQDVWTHVAGVYDGVEIRLYFNGVQVAAATHSGDLAPGGGPPRQHCPSEDTTLQIGKGWRGSIRQIRFWNRALGSKELVANAQQQLSGSEEGLVAYFPLDDGHEAQLAIELVSGTPRLARGSDETWERAAEEPDWWLTNPKFLVHEDWAEDMNETATPFFTAEVADINGDGYPDIVGGGPLNTNCPGDATTPMQMLINDGAGHFTLDTASVFSGPIPETEVLRRILVRDFNGDARDDLYIADHGDDCDFLGSDDLLILSSGTNQVVDATDTILAPPCTDSVPDPVGEKPCWIGSFRSGQPNVKRYPAEGPLVPPPLGYSHTIAAADIDGDMDVDIYVGNTAEARPYFLLNDGTGSFDISWEKVPDEMFETNDQGEPIYPTLVAHLADLDSDGHADLIIGPEAGHQVPGYYFDGWIVWNPGNGDFSTAAKTSLPHNEEWPFVSQSQPLSFDIDNDGDQDLLLPRHAEEPGRLIQILVNMGSRVFEDQTASRITVQALGGLWLTSALRAIDLNEDGCQDIQVELDPLFADGGPYIYLNDCMGFFSHVEADILGKPRNLFPLDADQDGDLDFISIEMVRPYWNPPGWYAPIAVLEQIIPELDFYQGFEESSE